MVSHNEIVYGISVIVALILTLTSKQWAKRDIKIALLIIPFVILGSILYLMQDRYEPKRTTTTHEESLKRTSDKEIEEFAARYGLPGQPPNETSAQKKKDKITGADADSDQDDSIKELMRVLNDKHYQDPGPVTMSGDPKDMKKFIITDKVRGKVYTIEAKNTTPAALTQATIEALKLRDSLKRELGVR